MNSRIMFLRTENNAPCGCVAISLDRKNHRISYQYSVLNPSDKFCRKMARWLALGRLAELPITVPVPRSWDPDMHDISRLVMRSLAQSEAPTRAVKAAKRWLHKADVELLLC